MRQRSQSCQKAAAGAGLGDTCARSEWISAAPEATCASAGDLPRSRRFRFGRARGRVRGGSIVTWGRGCLSGVGWSRRRRRWWCEPSLPAQQGLVQVPVRKQKTGRSATIVELTHRDRRTLSGVRIGGEIERSAKPHAARAAPAGSHNDGRHGDTSGNRPCGTSPRT